MISPWNQFNPYAYAFISRVIQDPEFDEYRFNFERKKGVFNKYRHIEIFYNGRNDEWKGVGYSEPDNYPICLEQVELDLMVSRIMFTKESECYEWIGSVSETVSSILKGSGLYACTRIPQTSI